MWSSVLVAASSSPPSSSTCWARWGRAWRGPRSWAWSLTPWSILLQSFWSEWVNKYYILFLFDFKFEINFNIQFSGFLLILLIESVVHKFFGGHGHSHFPSQETLAKTIVTSEVRKLNLFIEELSISKFYFICSTLNLLTVTETIQLFSSCKLWEKFRN